MIIKIMRYPVFMRLGLFPHERLTGQEVYVSLEADIGDHFLNAPEDKLSYSIDYGKIISAIEENLADKEIKLVETALLVLGNNLLEQFSLISKLQLQIEKPILPDGLGKNSQVSISHLFTRSPGPTYADHSIRGPSLY